MKFKIYIIILFLSSILGYSQQGVYQKVNESRTLNSIKTYNDVFSINSNSQVLDMSEFKNTASVTLLNLNSSTIDLINQDKPAFLQISIPFTNKSKINLELIPIDIFSPTYKVVDARNDEIAFVKGLFYQGIVKGDARSVVSIIIQDGELSGIVSTDKGNFVLGKLKNTSDYIFYNDRDLVQGSDFECSLNTELMVHDLNSQISNQTINTNVACRAVEVYVEADSALFKSRGYNMTTTTNFVNALFAQVAVLYSNENLAIQISELKIWNTTDPYASTTNTSTMLNAFGTQVGNTFNGDIAHLLSARSVGGGRAGLDVLCNKGKGVSGSINGSVYNVPTYSWNVMVVSHEIGHNFGSPHTQSCSWPGGPIDNCVAVESGPCSPGPAPTNGGTIMSYCHTTGYGINFVNGFGILPGNLIRQRTQECFGSALAPTNLTVIETSSSNAFLAWNHIGGIFTVRYKFSSSNTWITASTTNNTFIEITGLSANANYDWEVKSTCSPYASSIFQTNSNPPISYCTPVISTTCSNFYLGIDDFIVNGTNWNPNSNCLGVGGITLKFDPIRTLNFGTTYNFTLNPLWIGGNNIHASIWIDLNKNGIFETSERLFNTTTSTNNPINSTFAIPISATPISKTRLRVNVYYYNWENTPCGTITYGESEDYIINLSGPCPSSIALVSTADNINGGVVNKQASATSGLIDARNVISNAANVIYEAKAIELNKGFKADTGVVFEAKTGGCN
ncbi:hypothetical protein EGI22_23130 [Lacihabitans sp. LS3-19]|uniref:M12 family metallo-peptidase n=1 Tax=Lacihabitans sp. LS3-19 TaxID=2487335 RepID=UPI0020CD4FBA|nr:M12 family metallo-peptidase [Lacihabitans sp. LS3-19]MCP9770808.1 hypothetical protein [Lacihabitans sp. LS3-19]